MNRTNLKVRHILDDIPTKEEFQEVIEKVKLTPRQLEILELRFIRHLLNYEIADRLGLPLGTVKSRIFFTRQKLQQELKDFV